MEKMLKKRKKDIGEDFWPSISDLMSGLMIIFMFIAVSFMLELNKKSELNKEYTKTIEETIKKYKTGKLAIYEKLSEEFEEDLKIWNATLEMETLSISFNEPEIFFNLGQKETNERFKNLLDNFFPRYIKILSNTQFKNEIEEIRIEGHTSSEWNKTTSELDSYFNNMELSQARTVETLKYVMSIPEIENQKDFLIDKLTANGLSYSRRIINENGSENQEKSRRVEFKIRTAAEKHLDDMNKQIEKKEQMGMN